MHKTFSERLDSKFSSNRLFWDSVVLLVWCEVAIPPEHRREECRSDWLDILTPSYVGHDKHLQLEAQGIETVQVTGKTWAQYVAPREVLSRTDQRVLQQFIDTHYTESVTEFRLMAREAGIFTECQTVALNSVRHIPFDNYI